MGSSQQNLLDKSSGAGGVRWQAGLPGGRTRVPGAGQQDSTPRCVPQEHGAHSGHPCSHCRLKPKHLWKASALCWLQRQTTLQVACQSASQGSLRPGDPHVGWFPRERQSWKGACPALQTHPPGWASPPTLCTHSTP